VGRKKENNEKSVNRAKDAQGKAQHLSFSPALAGRRFWFWRGYCKGMNTGCSA